MPKTMVEHDFVLGQEEDTKGVKTREKHETQIKHNKPLLNLEQDTATKADIGLAATSDFGDR